MVYDGILNVSGDTPLIKMKHSYLDNINLFVKNEGMNPTGSVKDRAAKYIIDKVLASGEINEDTTIIESSSGNFGIALSCYCREKNLKCKIVIDPNILTFNEFLINHYAKEVIKVHDRDEMGGYLLTRTRLVKSIIEHNENYYWTNQYANPYIVDAYYSTLGEEICRDVEVDYIFLGVSSGGTITGVSRKVKDIYPNAKVIAVDSKGSVIFGQKPEQRCIPGIGSSMRPPILETARIDDVVIVNEEDAVNACHLFLDRYSMIIGGSSGSVYQAVSKYFEGRTFSKKPNVVIVFADRGERYDNTIYNYAWVQRKFMKKE